MKLPHVILEQPAQTGAAMTLEAEIQQRASVAPRVTPQDLDAEIASEHYFDALAGSLLFPECDVLHEGCDQAQSIRALGRLTFCVLVLRNGFTVVGKSACVSHENFDAAIGRRVARDDARDQLWLLLGFRLADKLAAAGG